MSTEEESKTHGEEGEEEKGEEDEIVDVDGSGAPKKLGQMAKRCSNPASSVKSQC